MPVLRLAMTLCVSARGVSLRGVCLRAGRSLLPGGAPAAILLQR